MFPRIADVLGTTVEGLLRECGGTYRDPEMLQKYLEGIRISGEYMLTQFDRILQERGSAGGPETAAWEAPLSLENIDRYLQERAGSDSIPAGRLQFAGKRILVAEDMEINREIAGEILKQTGATVEFAENGQICLDKLKAAPAGYYDLIMMDIRMPVMNGLEATRRIRLLPDRDKAGIPIIAVTTNVSEEDRKDALDAGMDAFEEKPIFTNRLFETVDRLLSQ